MKTFVITDGAVTDTASTLTDATQICERWYDVMQANGQLSSLPSPDLNGSSLVALNASLAAWEQGISRQSGRKVPQIRVMVEGA